MTHAVPGEGPRDGLALMVREGASEAVVAGDEASHALTRLFGRDSLYVLFWGLQLAFAALITPVATRLLSTGSYGRIMAATAVMQVLVAIGSMSLQAAVQRQYHEHDGPRAARRLVTLAIVVSLLTFGAAELTGPTWSSLLRLGPFRGAIALAVAWAALTAVSDGALAWIRSRDRLAVFGFVSLLQSVGASALSLALVVLVARTATEFIVGQLIGQALAVLVALAVARPLAIRRRDLPLVSAAMRYSGALVPAALAAFGLAAAARLIIQHDLGSTQVARYSIAFNIGTVPLILLGVLDIAWMPRVFGLSSGRARNAVLRQSRDAIYALLIPTVVGLSAGAPLVLAAWAPPRYDPGGLLICVALLCVSALALAGTMAATRVLLVSGETALVGSRTVLAALVSVGLTILLVPQLKLDGAALATLAGYVLQSILLTRAAQTVAPLPRPAGRLVAKCAAAAAVAGLCTQIPSGAPFVAVRGVVAVVCVAAFAAVFSELVVPGRFQRVSRLARRIHVAADGQ